MVGLNFHTENVTHAEFGVGRDLDRNQVFTVAPVGVKAQKALRDMVNTTWRDMQKSVEGRPTQTEFKETVEGNINSFTVSLDHPKMRKQLDGWPALYEASEKYAASEYLYLPIGDDKVKTLRDFHNATNIDLDNNILDNTDSIFCYFTRMTDSQSLRLTAIRRATIMKSALKKSFLSWKAGILDLSDTKTFMLDSDFDILIDSDTVHIWRPSSFESIGKLQKEILAAVSENITAIKQDIDFVDFKPIETYACSHIMAARYLASIRAQSTQGPISKSALVQLCETTGVVVEEYDGKLMVAHGHLMGFLEVLDRRRYGIELIEGNPERFRATSRQRIKLALP